MTDIQTTFLGETPVLKTENTFNYGPFQRNFAKLLGMSSKIISEINVIDQHVLFCDSIIKTIDRNLLYYKLCSDKTLQRYPEHHFTLFRLMYTTDICDIVEDMEMWLTKKKVVIQYGGANFANVDNEIIIHLSEIYNYAIRIDKLNADKIQTVDTSNPKSYCKSIQLYLYRIFKHFAEDPEDWDAIEIKIEQIEEYLEISAPSKRSGAAGAMGGNAMGGIMEQVMSMLGGENIADGGGLGEMMKSDGIQKIMATFASAMSGENGGSGVPDNLINTIMPLLNNPQLSGMMSQMGLTPPVMSNTTSNITMPAIEDKNLEYYTIENS